MPHKKTRSWNGADSNAEISPNMKMRTVIRKMPVPGTQDQIPTMKWNSDTEVQQARDNEKIFREKHKSLLRKLVDSLRSEDEKRRRALEKQSTKPETWT